MAVFSLHVLPLRQGLLLSCRDIKLENTLLDAHMPLPNVKLCDFGYSKNEFVDSRPKDRQRDARLHRARGPAERPVRRQEGRHLVLRRYALCHAHR